MGFSFHICKMQVTVEHLPSQSYENTVNICKVLKNYITTIYINISCYYYSMRTLKFREVKWQSHTAVIFVLPHSRVPALSLSHYLTKILPPLLKLLPLPKKQSPLNRYQWGVSPRWFIILPKRHFGGRIVRLKRSL